MKYNVVCSQLHIGQKIANWTVKNGYIGEPFYIGAISSTAIIVQIPPDNKEIRVSRNDFEKVAPIWEGYCNGNFQRQKMRGLTRCSKYIISIFHYLDRSQLEG